MHRLRLLATLSTKLSKIAVSPHRSIANTRDNQQLQGMCRRRLCGIATAVGLWALSTCHVYAALVTVTPIVSFNDSTSVTDTEGSAGSTSNDGATLGSTALDQFDAATGVLTDATINLVSTRTQSVTVSATAVGNGGKDVTSDGSGSSTASLTAPGASYTTSPTITANGSCTAKRKMACSTTTTAPGVTTNQDVAVSGSLDSYVGSDTVSVDRTAPILNATQGTVIFDGVEKTEYALTWTGDLSVTYSYLLHADPSFDISGPVTTLLLDFGTVTQNSIVSPLDFSLYNLAADDRTALDLDSINLTGGTDTGALDSNLAVFSDLIAGSEELFQATLNTDGLGSYLEVYTLTLSDADIGAASSRASWNLVVTLQGEVIAASSVPLPDAVWLFGSGLLGLVGVSRRKSEK
jgi:hypothetical protein